jgi:branched-subunit amino acid transport protein
VGEARVTGEAWAMVALVAAVTFAIKAAGPVALGGRELPGWASRVIALMAPALLAALIAVNALADDDRLHVGADTAGVAAAALVVARGGSVIWGVLAAAGVTAALRALGG